MKTIYKFPLQTVDRQVLSMPGSARILCAMNQHGLVTIWAEVDSSMSKEDRTFWIVGTGSNMPNVPLIYIGSVSQPPFIWHVYEEQR